MHPDSGAGLTRDVADALEFSTALFDTVPRVQAVNTHLATLLLQRCDTVRQIGDVVGSRTSRLVPAGHILAGATPKRNQEVGCWLILFCLQVPLEGFPKVLRPAKIDEGKGRRRTPVLDQTMDTDSAPKQISHRSDGGPVQKSQHGVIELVLPYPYEINIVGQAHRKVAPGRNWGNLHQRNPLLEYPCPQHADVSVERGRICILGRLAGCQEELHLIEQVIT